MKHEDTSSTSNLRRVLENIFWLLLDKVIKILLGVLVFAWIARYLGPIEFGKLNYAIALSTLALGFTALGLGPIVVKELIQLPENKDAILKASIILQLIAGSASTIAIIVFAFVTENDLTTKISICILSLPLTLRCSESIKYFFEAQVKSKISVIIENTVFLACALLKAILIKLELSTIHLAIVFSLESIISSIALIIYYKRRIHTTPTRFEKHLLKKLFEASWPLLISSLAFTLYSRVDQILLSNLSGDASAGIYSASTKIAESLFLIPVLISASLYPSIQKNKNSSQQKYISSLQTLYDIVTITGVISALLVSICSEQIVNVLYGQNYSKTATVLSIYVWSGVFVGLAIVSGRYFVSENLQRLTMYRHILGVVINIVLNILIIPTQGATGAAIVSLISFAIANYFFDAITPRTRDCFYQKTLALLIIPALYRLLRIVYVNYANRKKSA